MSNKILFFLLTKTRVEIFDNKITQVTVKKYAVVKILLNVILFKKHYSTKCKWVITQL